MTRRPSLHRPGRRGRSAEGQRGQLAAALARLPAAYRDTLLLVVWGDLSYNEAATALGIPIGTVRSRMNRARTSLRRSLTTAGEPEPHPPHGQWSAVTRVKES